MNQEAPPDRIQIAAQFMAALLAKHDGKNIVDDTERRRSAGRLSEYAFMVTDQFMIAAGIGCPKKAAADKMFEVIKLLCKSIGGYLPHPHEINILKEAKEKAVEILFEIRHGDQKQKKS